MVKNFLIAGTIALTSILTQAAFAGTACSKKALNAVQKDGFMAKSDDQYAVIYSGTHDSMNVYVFPVLRDGEEKVAAVATDTNCKVVAVNYYNDYEAN